MKKLLVLALFAFAAWYGWKHYPALAHKPPSHEAVISNQSGRTAERVRLTVGGRTFVREALEDGAVATFAFRVDNDSDFRLKWQWADGNNEQAWTGGMVAKGPMVQRHIITLEKGGGIEYRAEAKGATPS